LLRRMQHATAASRSTFTSKKEERRRGVRFVATWRGGRGPPAKQAAPVRQLWQSRGDPTHARQRRTWHHAHSAIIPLLLPSRVVEQCCTRRAGGAVWAPMRCQDCQKARGATPAVCALRANTADCSLCTRTQTAPDSLLLSRCCRDGPLRAGCRPCAPPCRPRSPLCAPRTLPF
jgi:hypothetical protein